MGTSKVEYSHTTRVRKDAMSVRTVIPNSIVRELEPGFNDLLEWQLEVKNGKKVMTVRKWNRDHQLRGKITHQSMMWL
jgi:hypothetical protein